MATYDITIDAGNLNVSLQVGDILYATLLDSNQSGVNTTSGNRPVAVGIITAIAGVIITINDDDFPAITLTDNHYLFFNKDKAVNTSGVLGYYASVEYRNYSKKKAEIFATGTEYAPSSK